MYYCKTNTTLFQSKYGCLWDTTLYKPHSFLLMARIHFLYSLLSNCAHKFNVAIMDFQIFPVKWNFRIQNSGCSGFYVLIGTVCIIIGLHFGHMRHTCGCKFSATILSMKIICFNSKLRACYWLLLQMRACIIAWGCIV